MQNNFNAIAHVTERVGLAMAGVACGVFVAAAVSHADSALLRSIWVAMVLIVAGGAGFATGADRAWRDDRRTRIDPVYVLRPTGTFIASAAALVAVIVLVFDIQLVVSGPVVLAVGWMIGTTLQMIAAPLVRHRKHPLVRRLLIGGTHGARA